MKNHISFYLITALACMPTAYAEKPWNRPDFNPYRYGSPRTGEDNRSFEIRVARELEDKEKMQQMAENHQQQSKSYSQEERNWDMIWKTVTVVGGALLAWLGWNYLENANKPEQKNNDQPDNADKPIENGSANDGSTGKE